MRFNNTSWEAALPYPGILSLCFPRPVSHVRALLLNMKVPLELFSTCQAVLSVCWGGQLPCSPDCRIKGTRVRMPGERDSIDTQQQHGGS